MGPGTESEIWRGSFLQDILVSKTKFVVNEAHVFFTYDNTDNSLVTRFWLNPLGSPERDRASGKWVTIYAVHKDDCDIFARCGTNGLCNINHIPVCQCSIGFGPKAPEDWEKLDSSGGCVLKMRFNCSDSELFKKLSRLKLPSGLEFSVNRTVVRKEDCELIFRRNRSCVAYAVARVCGCVVWFGDWFDIKRYSVRGQDLYIRMAASEFESEKDGKRTAVIVSTISGFLLFSVAGGYLIYRRTSCSLMRQETSKKRDSNEDHSPNLLEENVELPSFGLDATVNATNNFSSTNKIGEGGFGPVYKGLLSTGQEIAVKKLSKNSGQGPVEFKNEAISISKLQHRNLVRLLGCCIHKEERMLIYELLPNNRLVVLITDQTRGTALGRQKRFSIIVGIDRELLHLQG